jgi:hypothetical protein
MKFKTIILFTSILSITANAQEANVDSTVSMMNRLVHSKFRPDVIDEVILKMSKITDDCLNIAFGEYSRNDGLVEFSSILSKILTGKNVVIDSVIIDENYGFDVVFKLSDLDIFKQGVDYLCDEGLGDHPYLLRHRFNVTFLASNYTGKVLYRTVIAYKEQGSDHPNYRYDSNSQKYVFIGYEH